MPDQIQTARPSNFILSILFLFKCLIQDFEYMMNYENYCLGTSLILGRETENTP